MRPGLRSLAPGSASPPFGGAMRRPVAVIFSGRSRNGDSSQAGHTSRRPSAISRKRISHPMRRPRLPGPSEPSPPLRRCRRSTRKESRCRCWEPCTQPAARYRIRWPPWSAAARSCAPPASARNSPAHSPAWPAPCARYRRTMRVAPRRISWSQRRRASFASWAPSSTLAACPRAKARKARAGRS